MTTGGADARNATGGVQSQMLLKSGGAAPHGGVHYYYEGDRLQTVNISNDLALALASPTGNSNRMGSYNDLGFDVGGPLLQDHAWIWGTVNRSNVTALTFNDLTDETHATTYAMKADGIIAKTIRGNFTFFENSRTENGRGAGLFRLAEAAWNETGPARYYKGEGRFLLGPKVVASARGAYITHAFTLTPAGGLTANYYVDDAGTAHNSYYEFQTTRPQRYAAGDVSALLGLNAIEAGLSYRDTPIDNQTIYPGNHIVTIWNSYPNMIAQVSRDVHQNTGARYLSGFARDTLSFDRLTVTGGVRFDRQSSSLKAASVPAVAGFETLLPAVTAAARRGVRVDQRHAESRGGVRHRRRPSRDRARQLRDVRVATRGNAGGLRVADSKRLCELRRGRRQQRWPCTDERAAALAGNQEQRWIRRQESGERHLGEPRGRHACADHARVVAGVDADLPWNLSLTAAVTYRKMVDLLWSPLIGVRAAQYAPAGTLSGTLPELGSFSVPLYALKAASVPAGGGLESVNRTGYHQRYVGFELGAAKRMSNHWMARVALSTNEWREYFDDPAAAIVDPTKAPAPSALRPFAGPQIDGGPVLQLASGTGQSSVFMVAPKYQVAVDGLFTLPFGFDLAGNLVTRPGYSEPFYRSNVDTGDPLGLKTVLLTSTADAFRLPAVTLLNARLEKKFVFGTAKVAIDFDVFNAFNSDTVLGKQYDARMTGAYPFGQVLEIMNPRIARLGFRLVF